MLIALADWWATSHVEEVTRIWTGQSLEAVLNSVVSAINHWEWERLSDAKAAACNTGLVGLIEKQLIQSSTPQSLKASPHGKQIKAFLEPLHHEKGYQAFILVDLKRRVISATQPDALGVPSCLAGRGD